MASSTNKRKQMDDLTLQRAYKAKLEESVIEADYAARKMKLTLAKGKAIAIRIPVNRLIFFMSLDDTLILIY